MKVKFLFSGLLFILYNRLNLRDHTVAYFVGYVFVKLQSYALLLPQLKEGCVITSLYGHLSKHYTPHPNMIKDILQHKTLCNMKRDFY